ncbi:deoxyribose-phosphate aldolase [Pseudonocardia halophobica]|uniref:Deoxyribose-phosphate aldolase n=1 Tax=Pseudonocardia halophobica TaxID=29401 RepID=A0A9W6LCV9_9PSEU|nr:deoxyribose-phosphate aldolase [Pseudonocardia halophobica]GLL14514.1 deoxyribose-phosphate aldolase [Pseudonocardia halophobica]
MTLDAPAIAAMIDHAILRPELTRAQLDADLAMAERHRVFSVCVRPSDVAHAVSALAGSGVAVGTVLGFPHGTTSTAAKVAEARQALADGAAELDMVLNIGRLRSGLLDDVEADIAAVVGAAGDRVVKVILETAFLTGDEIVAGCHAAEAAGAAFVKTSTGFAGGGATAEHVALMRASVGSSVQVKASGGVRDLDTLLTLHELGATRFGTSASAVILEDAAARDAGRRRGSSRTRPSDSVAARTDGASY